MVDFLAESFETGAPGGALHTTNTNFNSLVEPGWTFVNSPTVSGQGAQAAHVVTTAGHAQLKATFTAQAVIYATIFLRPNSAPSADVIAMRFAGGGSTLAELQFTSGQTLKMRNSGAIKIAETPANFAPLGSYLRAEWLLDTTVDKQQLRVFKGNNVLGTIPDYDSGLVATTAVGSADTVTLGVINSTTWDAYVDAVSLNATGWRSFGGTSDAPLLRASTSTPFADANTTTALTIPTSGVGGTVGVGDVAYIIFYGSTSLTTQTAPSDWVHLTGQPGTNGVCADVWAKTLTAADLASTVTLTHTNTVTYRRQAHLLIFSNAQVGDAKSTLESVVRTGHPALAANAVDQNATVINSVADRGSGASAAWTLPSNLTLLEQEFGTAGGSISSVSAYDDLVGSGSAGANTITGTISTNAAVMVTLVVEPASGAVPHTVSAGADITSEPWKPIVRRAVSSTAPASWTWTEINIPAGKTAMTLSGATTATVSFTTPADIASVTRTLQVSASFSDGSTVVDQFKVDIYPVTRRCWTTAGVEVPLRRMLFT
jgi:hypothetical protein